MGGKSSKSSSGKKAAKLQQQLNHADRRSPTSDDSDDDLGNSKNEAELEQEEVSFTVGASSIQGKRPYNEDRYAVHTPLPLIKAHEHIKSWNLFAVYDGHGECGPDSSTQQRFLLRVLTGSPLICLHITHRWCSYRSVCSSQTPCTHPTLSCSPKETKSG
jgi:hypothetical protein